MARLYTKDLARRVTIRLDERLSEFITTQARTLGVTPSEWCRMVLHAYMNTVSGVVGLAGALADDMISSGKAVAEDENKASD